MRHRRPLRVGKEAVYDLYARRFVHLQKCIVCGAAMNIQASHVGIGGIGLKHGSGADVVPMCGPGILQGCHADWEQYKGTFLGWTREQRDEKARKWRLWCWRKFLGWCEAGGYDDDQSIDCQDRIRDAIARMETT